VATLIENNRNKGKTKSKCTSKYKGVCFDKQTSKWVSHIRVNGKTIKLGRYLIEEEAAQAYNEAAIKYFGEFARLNVLFDAGVIV
jgi:hypothetical protein